MPITQWQGYIVYRECTMNGSPKIKSCDTHFLSMDGKTQVCLHQHAVVSFLNLPIIFHNKDKGPATDQQLVASFSTRTLGFNTINPFGGLSVFMTGVSRPLLFPFSAFFH